jgi:hypothetical protein
LMLRGPNVVVDTILALVVSPSKAQLPVNGFGPEPPPELLFLQAATKRRQTTAVIKGIFLIIIKAVFMVVNEITRILVCLVAPGIYYFSINISLT